MQKYGYIDCARGIAILLVILSHAAQTIPDLSELAGTIASYGQFGVELFFVASAYTLCLSHEQRAGEPIGLTSFFIRRYFRIAPLYYIAIPIYFFAFSFFTFDVGGHVKSVTQYLDPANIISNILFVHAFYPPANNNIVPGGWSIGVEMVFYLAFPMFYAVLAKAQRINRFIYLGLFALLLIANGLFQIRLESYSGHTIDDNDFAAHFVLNQMPVFVIGMVSFFIDRNRSEGDSLPSTLASLVGFLCFFSGGMYLLSGVWSRSLLVVPSIVAFAFVYLLRALRSLPRIPILEAIGRASYSMYILHFLFAWGLTPALIARAGVTVRSEFVLVGSFVISAMFTFVAARYSQRYIEGPGIRMGASIIRRLRSDTRQVSLSRT